MRFYAPGRVNLIGEHLDYNGGLVFPKTISRGISLDIQFIPEKKWVFESSSKNSYQTDDLRLSSTKNQWYDYPLSVLNLLISKGFDIPFGLQFSYNSTLPEGSGLSSSAAILVVTLNALNEIFHFNLSPIVIAQLAQQAENQYLNVQCGIMDSFVIAHNIENSALLIDCKSLAFQSVPANFDDVTLLIMNTKKPRKLQHSAYNERRQSCELALSILQKNHPSLQKLADATENDLIALREAEIIYKRAKHVVSEQARVLQSVDFLKAKDFKNFGKMLNLSHESLKNDFEVSCQELDFLVEQLQKQEFCFGARMTGAGFGGCAIALLQKGNYEVYWENLSKEYEKNFGWKPEFYV